MAIRVLLVVSLVLCVSSSGYGDDAAPPKVKVKQAAPAKVKKVVPAKRIKVVATPPQARKMLLKERRALAKKLFETQQAAKEAAQILAEVEKANRTAKRAKR